MLGSNGDVHFFSCFVGCSSCVTRSCLIRVSVMSVELLVLREPFQAGLLPSLHSQGRAALSVYLCAVCKGLFKSNTTSFCGYQTAAWDLAGLPYSIPVSEHVKVMQCWSVIIAGEQRMRGRDYKQLHLFLKRQHCQCLTSLV